MKITKQLLLTLILSTTCFNALFSQIPPDNNVITLDFNTKKIAASPSLEAFKTNQYFQLKIINFNPYLYKVTLNKTDTANNQINTTPALFNIFSVANLTGLVSSLTAMAPAGTNGAAAPPLAKPGKKPAIKKTTTPVDPCSTIEKFINDEKATVLSIYRNTITLNSDVNSYKFHLQKAWLKTQLLDFTNIGCIDSFDCSTFYTMVNSFIERKNAIVNAAYDRYMIYQNTTNACTSKIAKDPILRSSDSIIRKFYATQTTDFPNQFDTTIGYKALPQILSQLINLNSPSTFQYLSLPMQITSDAVSLTINIAPQTNIAPLQSYNTTLLFPLQHKQFWNFSAGFYISGLHSEVYSNQAINDSTFNLLRERNGNIEVGINALIHYGHYYRSKDWFWHGALGPGLALLKNPVPRLMIGGGLGYGRRNKVFFTIGGLLGQVDRLGGAYHLGIPFYQQAQSNYTVSSIKFNGFFSISYSFLGSN